ncbi:MAG: DNA mismatch repair endonuclease MutL [Saprospiraceae bacterium]|nr:DNA mismatch repair endonuclease MutL [Saprospiraceae bacterium]
MSDIIKLLPDSIANQIAAGEVIQRPASVVKELLENALDADSTSIKLIIKDAGKTLVQVIDDGKGMSETDARMSFERHATSKIRSANDLFSIRTMGFRGEALASIAAIAQVELITRQHHEDIANRILIEGSLVSKQELIQSAPGTTISVRNLFFNVPARRKFLKSDPVELRHIMDEFHRVALANPEISFSFYHNGNEVYHLPKSGLKQRIISILGKNLTDKLLPVSEETEIVNFSGFAGKAESVKKTQGDQYIFVNKRFIRSNYLNHAIRSAYEEMIQKDQFPAYVLFLEIDPAAIDINVHPTKTEIKFEDERMIYNYLRVTLKHALGQYSVATMLDFGVDHNFGHRSDKASNFQPQVPKYKDVEQDWRDSAQKFEKENILAWQEMYKGLQTSPIENEPVSDSRIIESEAFRIGLDEQYGPVRSASKEPIQLHNCFIMHQVKAGVMIIDQQSAHERILYEQYMSQFSTGEHFTQKELFPRTIELDGAKTDLVKSILDEINALGFEMSEFGRNTFIIHGTPAGLDTNISIEALLEKLIDCYAQNLEFELGIQENLARSMAVSASVKRGRPLSKEEMLNLVDKLFACEVPYKSPSGNRCFIIIETDELNKRFNL